MSVRFRSWELWFGVISRHHLALDLRIRRVIELAVRAVRGELVLPVELSNRALLSETVGRVRIPGQNKLCDTPGGLGG